jgi:hypothetical protein
LAVLEGFLLRVTCLSFVKIDSGPKKNHLSGFAMVVKWEKVCHLKTFVWSHTHLTQADSLEVAVLLYWPFE